jgi:dolichol-phosphate mannosyltransferase
MSGSEQIEARVAGEAVPSPILVVIPTYNEAENIGALIPAVLEATAGHDVSVLVVDDASTDGGDRIVARLAKDDARVRLLSREAKFGLGTAYMAGFRHALDNGFGLAVTMDADFSHSPALLPAVFEAAARCDVVIGSRYVPGGGIARWPLHRKLLSWGANWLARRVIGIQARDCTSGFRAYRREILERVVRESIRSDGYSFLIELLAILERSGARVAETPIVFVDRVEGVSKISKAEIYKAFGTLWRLRRGRRQSWRLKAGPQTNNDRPADRD